jgi:alkylation response protein AidB-like acyl-CoA dehydrogenase
MAVTARIKCAKNSRVIDFSLSDDQARMLDTLGAFLRKRLPADEVRRRDRDHIPPYDLLPEMGSLGLFRLAAPAEHGGLDEPWTSVALAQEALGRHAYMAASIFNRVVAFGVQSLITYGTARQQRELLPGLLDGRALFALALSEAEAGSDAAAIRTLAEKVEGGWRINGRKIWISDAQAATHLITVARTRPHPEKDGGITVFMVPRGSVGISMTILPKVGNNAMPSWDIGFQDVLVPDDAVMGEVGRGLPHVLSTLHYSRASMAATVTGCAQAVVDLALQHARARVQFGRPIGSFQVIRHRLADMQMRVDQARLITYHLAWLIGRGERSRRQAAQAKVIATEALQFVADHGMQITASSGYSSEGDMQRYWRDARLYSFGEGSNEIQRDLISKEMGL